LIFYIFSFRLTIYTVITPSTRIIYKFILNLYIIYILKKLFIKLFILKIINNNNINYNNNNKEKFSLKLLPGLSIGIILTI